jgi:hypothetical protein
MLSSGALAGRGLHDAVERLAMARLMQRPMSRCVLPWAVRRAWSARVSAWQRIGVIATVCSARFRARSPPRLRRCLVGWPLLASSGATPARQAKAASSPTRPGETSRSAAGRPRQVRRRARRGERAGGMLGDQLGELGLELGELGGQQADAGRDRRQVRVVLRCSMVAAAAVGIASMRSSCRASGRPRGLARRGSGATMMRLFRSLMAVVRPIKTA